MTYTVLWDGTTRAGGRMLFAEEPQTIQPETGEPRVTHPGGPTVAVRATRALFRGEWFTARQMAQVAGVTTDGAARVIASLRRRGELEVEQIASTAGRYRGGVLQRYRWVTR